MGLKQDRISNKQPNPGDAAGLWTTYREAGSRMPSILNFL